MLVTNSTFEKRIFHFNVRKMLLPQDSGLKLWIVHQPRMSKRNWNVLSQGIRDWKHASYLRRRMCRERVRTRPSHVPMNIVTFSTYSNYFQTKARMQRLMIPLKSPDNFIVILNICCIVPYQSGRKSWLTNCDLRKSTKGLINIANSSFPGIDLL